ncbi:hypothetical protein [Microbacterium sp. E-13]|uniref:hypothetical protein n=1 Tax=Microbacterium sp. E-13 TaxID=3404048 RepID=UPI003CFB71A6
MLDTTGYLWIIPESTSVATIRGLLQALESLGALPEADIQILTVSADHGVELPPGFETPSGAPVPPGILDLSNLPPQGLLVQRII